MFSRELPMSCANRLVESLRPTHSERRPIAVRLCSGASAQFCNRSASRDAGLRNAMFRKGFVSPRRGF